MQSYASMQVTRQQTTEISGRKSFTAHHRKNNALFERSNPCKCQLYSLARDAGLRRKSFRHLLTGDSPSAQKDWRAGLHQITHLHPIIHLFCCIKQSSTALTRSALCEPSSTFDQDYSQLVQTLDPHIEQPANSVPELLFELCQ